MSIALPTHPAPTDATPSYLDWGGMLRPIFGGSIQKLLRLGDRFALDVSIPPLGDAPEARLWTSRLVQAQRAGAIFAWPQLDCGGRAIGSPKMSGAGQAGALLTLDGFIPGAEIVEGRFFSLVHGGRRYLHFATAGRIAAADGTMVLPIAPMLRVQPADDAPCEFVQPMIEGFLEGDSRSWTIDVEMTVGVSFRIMEAK